METESSRGRPLVPALVAAAVICAALIGVLFWPRGEKPGVRPAAREGAPVGVAKAPDAREAPASVKPEAEAPPTESPKVGAKEKAPPAKGGEAAEGGVIRGKVVSKADGSPIGGVLVAARPHEEAAEPSTPAELVRLARTDIQEGDISSHAEEDGTFSIEGLEPGPYRLFVRNEGRPFIPLPPSKGPTVDLSEKPRVEGLEIALEPGAVFFGEVRDKAEEAIAGSRVGVRPADPFGRIFEEGMAAFVGGRHQDTTTEKGAWRIAGLPFGRKYIVSARAEGLAPTESDAIEARPEEPEIRVDLILHAGSGVRGRVVDGEGAPVTGVGLVLTSGEMFQGAEPPGAETAADGSFAFEGIPAGSYGIMAALKTGDKTGDIPELHDLGRVEVDGIGDVEGLELVLALKGKGEKALAGRVVDESGVPLEGAKVELGGLAAGGGPRRKTATTGADGTFRFEGIARGMWNLTATKEGYASGGAFNASADAQPIEIVLRRKGRISGRVIARGTEEPIEKASVRAVPVGVSEESLRNMMQGGFPGLVGGGARATTAADGTFLLEADPGTLRLAARAPGLALGFSEEIVLLPGEGREGVVIALSTGGSIAGRVLDPDGRPAAGAAVRVALRQGNPLLEYVARLMPALVGAEVVRATADADGSFLLEHLAAGTHTVVASGAGAAESEEVEIELGIDEARRGIDLALRRPARIVGKVLRKGEPAPGYMVQLIGSGPMKMATTQPDGSFALEGIPPGPYMMNVMNPMGLMTGKGLGDIKVIAVEIEAGQVLEKEIRLAEGAKVHGKVRGIGEGGMSMVTLRRPGGPAPEDVAPFDMAANVASARYQVGMSFIGEDDAYAIEGVPDGTFIVEVVRMPTGSPQAMLDPGARKPIYRGEVEVRNGRDVKLDIRIPRVGTGSEGEGRNAPEDAGPAPGSPGEGG